MKRFFSRSHNFFFLARRSIAKTALAFSFLVLPLTAFAVTGWTTDHNNCDTSYLSIDCPAGQKICAYNGTLTCGDPTTINALLPSTLGTADNKNYEGTGGYLINCTNSAADCTSPWECKAAQSCANLNLKTTCTGSAHTSSCGTCLTGYLDCNGDGNGGDVDGCEIQIGGVCTSGSLSGTYESTCQGSSPPVCNTENVAFRTAEQASASSSNPLLWGTQYGAGYLLNLSKDGGNSVVINNGGKVGIGTTSPAMLLHLQNTQAGQLRLDDGDATSGAANNGAYMEFGHSGTTWARDAYLGFGTGGGNFTIENEISGGGILLNPTGGNVGIGTTSPGAKLDIKDDGGAVKTAIFARGYDTNSPFNMYTRQFDETGVNILIGELGLEFGTTQNAAMRFYRGSGGTGGFITFAANDGTEKMRIASSGAVGIGTTSPGAALDVSGTGHFSSTLKLDSTLLFYGGLPDQTANLNPIIYLTNGSGQYDALSLVIQGRDYASTPGSIYLTTGDNTGIALQAKPNQDVIVPTGNVGIGIASPTEALDVAGNIAATGTICDGANNCLDSLQNSAQWTASGSDIYYNTGNVGIGTTSPATALDVTGAGTFSTGLSVTSGTLSVGNGNLAIQRTAANPRIILTEKDATVDNEIWDFRAANEKLIFQVQNDAQSVSTPWLNVDRTGTTIDQVTFPNGNVGIGTTTPGTKLHIYGDQPALRVADNGGVQVRMLGGNTYGVIGTESNDALALQTNNTNAMYIDASQKVGIGTDTPGEKLEVAGNMKLNWSQDYVIAEDGTAMGISGKSAATASVLNLYSNDGDGTDGVYFQLYGKGQLGSATNRELMEIFWNAAGSSYDIGTFNAGTGTLRPLKLYTQGNTNQLVLSTGGNIGIGTASPAQTLHVAGAAMTDSYLIALGGGSYGTQADTGAIRMTNNKFIGWRNAGNTANFTFGVNSSDKFEILGGEVGIGTSAPTKALDVNGQVRIRANTKGTCDANAAGTLAYEETTDVGVFYGCKRTGTSTYQWVQLEIFGS